MTKALALCAALVAAPIAAEQLPAWFRVGTTDTGTVFYARTADLQEGRSNQTAAKVWVHMDSSRDRTVSFKEARILYVVNCVVRTSQQVQATAYDRSGHTETMGIRAVEFIIPDSNMDRVADLLCSDPDPEPDYR